MEYQKSLKQAKESSNEARQKAATALSAMPSTQVGYSLHCSLVGSTDANALKGTTPEAERIIHQKACRKAAMVSSAISSSQVLLSAESI